MGTECVLCLHKPPLLSPGRGDQGQGETQGHGVLCQHSEQPPCARGCSCHPCLSPHKISACKSPPATWAPQPHHPARDEPPQASALWGPLGRGWWPLSVPLCRRVTSQGTPEPTRPVATVFPHQTAGVKPQKWGHSSSGNVRDDREAQGTAQTFLQGWGGAQDGTNSKEKRQKNPSGVIYLHQGSPRAGAVGAGGVLRGCRGVWGCSQGSPGS